jgi:hypothetical protein
LMIGHVKVTPRKRSLKPDHLLLAAKQTQGMAAKRSPCTTLR